MLAIELAPLKALCPILVKLEPSSISKVVNAEQSLNAYFPIVSTDFARCIVVNKEQPSNAFSPIVVNFVNAGLLNDVNFTSPIKAPLPIVSTSRNFMVSRFVILANALCAIVLRLLPSRAVIPKQPLNAFESIVSTLEISILFKLLQLVNVL